MPPAPDGKSESLYQFSKEYYREKNWSFEVYIDRYFEAPYGPLNVNAVPAVFVFNSSGNMIFRKYGYRSGQERIFDQLATDYKNNPFLTEWEQD